MDLKILIVAIDGSDVIKVVSIIPIPVVKNLHYRGENKGFAGNRITSLTEVRRTKRDAER